LTRGFSSLTVKQLTAISISKATETVSRQIPDILNTDARQCSTTVSYITLGSGVDLLPTLGGHPFPFLPLPLPPSLPLTLTPFPSFPFPSLPFRFPLFPFPPSPFLTLPLPLFTAKGSGGALKLPLLTAKGSGGALKLPQRVRAEPGRQTNFGAFWFKITTFHEANHS